MRNPDDYIAGLVTGAVITGGTIAVITTARAGLYLVAAMIAAVVAMTAAAMLRTKMGVK